MFGIVGYLSNLRFQWFEPVLKVFIERHGKDIPVAKVSELLDNKLQAMNKPTVEYEYKLKAVIVMRASISEILYVLNHIETR